MCYMKHICCLCLESSNEMTHYLFKTSDSSTTYYEKLTTSLPQLVFNKNYNDYVLCVECCRNINFVYEFTARCIENLNTFFDYKGKFSTCNSDSCATDLKTADIQEKAANYNKFTEQDENDRHEIEVMVHTNITENETMQTIKNVKLEQVDEDDVLTQSLITDKDVGMKIKLETEALVKRRDQVMEVGIQDDMSGNVPGGSDIKIEEDEKVECLDYEFISCDNKLDFCELKEDSSSVQKQLESRSSLTEHRSPEPNQPTCDKNTARSSLSHSYEPNYTDVIKEQPINDPNVFNATSFATHSRARLDTSRSEVDMLRIHQESTSEKEASKPSSSLDSLVHPCHVCDVCDEKFNNSLDLVEHKAVHTERPHVCHVCKKGFRYPSALVTHKRIHTDQRPYACDVCKKEFKLLYNLTTHKRIHSADKPFVCDICKKGFSYASLLVAHTRIHTGHKPYACDICEKKFNLLCNLTAHKRTHTGEKNYICDVCNKGLGCSFALVLHKRIHTNEKPYTCDVCEKAFSQLSTLTTHKRVHTGEKPHVCDICEKGFSSSAELVIHTRVHTGEKPYVCDICQKGFKHSSDLIKHTRVHTGQKPYVCEICNKEFRHSSTLTTHRRTHTGERPYVCDICQKGFSQSSNLASHKRTHRGLTH